MVPIYALTSWFSMIFPRHRLTIDTSRDCYEAFVLYSFVMLLIEYCGGDRKLVIRFEMKEKALERRQRCLALFKEWGERFENRPAIGSLFIQTYEK